MGLPGGHCREGETTPSGPTRKRQRYCHGTKDGAAKLRTQTQTPQMKWHDDIPQPQEEQKPDQTPHDVREVGQEEQKHHQTPHDVREGGAMTPAKDDLGNFLWNRTRKVVVGIVCSRHQGGRKTGAKG
jgi:hypothetical protein